MISVADPGFPTGGSNYKERCQSILGIIFPQKLHENETKIGLRGVSIPCAPKSSAGHRSFLWGHWSTYFGCETQGKTMFV